MNNNSPASHQDDEIDLFELMATLWQNKWIIVGITFLCTILAIIASYLITPTYRTESVLKPITPNSLYVLSNLNQYAITPESLFLSVEKELYSYDNREKFLLANEELLGNILKDVPPTQKEQVIDRFLTANLTITPSAKDASQQSLTIALTYPKGTQGPQIVNHFVTAMTDKVKQEIPTTIQTTIGLQRVETQNQLAVLLAGYEASINSSVAKLTEEDALKKLQLQDELAATQLVLRTQRSNRIEALNEAISIAETLNFQKPTSPGMESNKAQSSNILRAELVQQQIPLYFLGTEALTAERDALLKRTSDDFTSPRIAAIEGELLLLENNRKIEMLKARDHQDLFLDEIMSLKQKLAELSIKEKGVKDSVAPFLPTFDIVNIDEKAITPLSPLKPNKKLITIIGFLLGGMIGVIFVLLRQGIRNYQKKLQQTTSL